MTLTGPHKNMGLVVTMVRLPEEAQPTNKLSTVLAKSDEGTHTLTINNRHRILYLLSMLSQAACYACNDNKDAVVCQTMSFGNDKITRKNTEDTTPTKGGIFSGDVSH